ncbi:MAG: BtpA/SgcQ family protein, partial [Planctomycetota bacterium]|nr:BtpA/SgcQ family protein [Planctomycetota bacterium]
VTAAKVTVSFSSQILLNGNFSSEDLAGTAAPAALEDLEDFVRSLARTHRRWLSSSISTDPPTASRYTSSESGRSAMSFPFAVQSNSIIGVVHLTPLPGSPGYRGSRQQILDSALTDAQALIDGGVHGIIVENFGDTPFTPSAVEATTVAEMSVVVRAICLLAGALPVGVNVLRNDAAAALAIAAATGSTFIRVNVHTSAVLTDQGWISGRAHETLRQQISIDAGQVAIAADVGVKHALHPEGFDAAKAAVETVGRGRADAVIITGNATGASLDLDQLVQVREAIPSTALVAGSGVDVANVAAILAIADAAIVGTSLKQDGQVDRMVDVARVQALVEAAAR